MMETEIAKLVGNVSFNVDTTGLRSFRNMIAQLNRQIKPLIDKSKQLEKALNMRINPETGKKALASRERAIEREARAEASLRQQRQQTFQAELRASELRYKGMERASALQDQLFQRAKSQQKEIAALALRAEAKRKPGRPAGPAKQATAERIRLARLEAIHARTTERSRHAELRAQQQMNVLQRGNFRLSQMKREAEVKTARNTARVQTLADAKRRADAREARQVERHEWARQRQATRAAQGSNTASMFGRGALSGVSALASGGVGPALLSGMAIATGPLGALAAAAFAATQSLQALNAYVEQRKQDVIASQGYAAPFLNVSSDKELQVQARQEFERIQTKNAGAIDADAAQQFAGYSTTMLKMGRTFAQITAEWDKRQRAFRIGGLDAQAQRDMNREFTRLQASGRADAADVEQITDRLPGITPYLAAAAAKGTKLEKASADKQIGEWNKNLKDGKGLSADVFNRALDAFLKDNAAAFERSLQSVAAKQQQLDNEKFLQKQGLDANPELAGAMQDRINAEKELNDAMEPVREAFVQMDIALTTFNTGLIKLGSKLLGAEDTAAHRNKVPVVDKAGNPVLDGSGKPVMGERPLVGISKVKDEFTNNPDDSRVERAAKSWIWGTMAVFPPLKAMEWVDDKLQSTPMTVEEQTALAAQATAKAAAAAASNANLLTSKPTTFGTGSDQTPVSVGAAGAIQPNTPIEIKLDVNTTVNAATSDPSGLANALAPHLEGKIKEGAERAFSSAVANARSQQKETRR